MLWAQGHVPEGQPPGVRVDVGREASGCVGRCCQSATSATGARGNQTQTVPRIRCPHCRHRSSRTRPATNGSCACRPALPISTAGSTTACAPAWPIPRSPSYKTWDGLAARLIDAQVRRPCQSCPSPGRSCRCPPRLAFAGAGRARCVASPGHVGSSPRHVATGSRRFRRSDDRLAGAPGRRACRGAGDRPLGGDGSQRHTRRPHRGSSDLAARPTVGRLGDGAVVRRVPAEPRHDASSSARRCMPTSSAIRAPSHFESWSARVTANRSRRWPSTGRRSPRRARRSAGQSRRSRGSSAIRYVSWPRRRASTGDGCSRIRPGRCRSSTAPRSQPCCRAPPVGCRPSLPSGQSAGLMPLTVHLADRAVDLGPVADTSFVRAAS